MTKQPTFSASPAVITTSVATAIVAYAIHTTAWIAHQLAHGAPWPRWLELTYLTSLLIWLGAFGVALVARSRHRKAGGRPVFGDERTAAVFMRAHQVALVVVVLAQVPFFIVPLPAPALAQLTVTTAVVSLFAAYAWMDR